MKEYMAERKSKDLFQRYLENEIGHEVEAELRFYPTRKWCFDYAIPELKIAIEIDGGVWTYGRHNRASGYVKDVEKLNTAASLGWLVLRIVRENSYTNATLELIKQTIKARNNEG